MDNLKRWEVSNEKKAATTIEESKFILDQAEKKLKETLAIGDLIVDRTTTLITLVTGLLIGLIGYTVNKCSENHCNLNYDIFTKVVIFTIPYLFFVLIYNATNIRGTNYKVLGASPKTLFVDDFYNITDNKVREKAFIWAQIVNYQNSIDSNELTNKKRWRRFNTSILLLILIPVEMILLSLLLNCI